MVRRCLCVLFVDYQTRSPQVSSDAVAGEIVGADLDHALEPYKKAVMEMMSLGSYYRRLKTALGAGVILALGTKIGETT